MSGYKTRQRTVITELIEQNGDKHITVDELVSQLEAAGESVGRTTVYRCLEKLEQEGTVRKYIPAGKEGCCYQYVGHNGCKEHFHLKCEKCGRLIHIECNHLDELSNHISAEHGFIINELKTVLYGVCEGCKDK